jgi:hypothetical protein
MGSRVVRSLVLTSSLLLALPQGWCCILASRMARAATTTATPPPVQEGRCCDCCTQDAPPESAATEKRSAPPTEKPSAPPSRCCADRHALLSPTPSSKQPGADLAFAGLLPPLDPLHALVGAVGETVWVVHPPTCPLHVFECVWLC